MVPQVLAALGRSHDPDSGRTCGRCGSRRRAPRPSTSTSSTAAPGRRVADWEQTLAGGGRPRPAPRERLRPHRRGGHAAGRRPGPAPRRRRPGRQVPAGRGACSPARAWPTTRSRTGPGPGTTAATTSSTGPRATTWGSAAPPTPTARAGAGGTSALPSATSRRCGPGRATEAAGEDLDPERRRIEGLQLALRTRAGVPVEALADEDRAVCSTVSSWSATSGLVLTVEGRLLANEVAVRLR